jgi:hypothetical protein
MAFHATTRWGGDGPEPPVERLREILGQLDAGDDEHTSVSLTHESEWGLGTYRIPAGCSSGRTSRPPTTRGT